MKTTIKSLALILTLASSTLSASQWDDWISYQRPAQYDSIVTTVYPMMRDGTKLACSMAVPAKDGEPAQGKFPGIISNITPYALLEPLFEYQIKYWATMGYQALTCSVRGSGDSEGEFPHPNQPAEWNDSYDLVEWFAAQPQSNGRIGQEGGSYGGMTSFQAGIGQPPHLFAIAPMLAPNDLYQDAVYRGGVKMRPGVTDIWPLSAVGLSGGRIDANVVFDTWLIHRDHDSLWDGIEVGRKLSQIHVPVLMVSGWNDLQFSRGAVRNFEQMVLDGNVENTWWIAGLWGHVASFDGEGCVVLSFTCAPAELRLPSGILLAWFDHWLKMESDAPLPPSRIVSSEGPENIGTGWKQFDQWPPAAATVIEMKLRQDRTLSETAGPKGVRSFSQHPWGGVGNVIFKSELLPSDMILAGDISVNLKFSVSTSDANVQAELFEVREGKSYLIRDGWLKLSHYESHVTPTPLIANKIYEANVEIWPIHRRIPAGSFLKLKISGGGFWRILPVEESTVTSVYTGEGGSSLRLTVMDE